MQTQRMLKDSGSDRAGILWGLARYLVAALILGPVNKLYWVLLRSLRQQWEGHLTEQLLDRFVEAQCLGLGGGGVECENSWRNPDQRIARDVGVFVSLATSLSLETLDAVIHLYFNGSLLRSISPELSRWATIGATVGTLCTSWIGRHLSALYWEERRADGDFVYVLTRVRENAESIAFYGGQELESRACKQLMRRRLDAEWVRLARRDVTQLFSLQYRKALGLLPAYVLAGRVTQMAQPHTGQKGSTHGHAQRVRGGTDVALLGQASEAFDEVLHHLSILATNCSDFSRLAAVSVELYGYHCAQERAAAVADAGGPRAQGWPHSRNGERSGSCGGANASVGVVIENLAQSGPGLPWLHLEAVTLGFRGRVLVSNLTVDAPRKGGLLITGPSGAGKTSLLRAIAGLWRGSGGGVVRRGGGHAQVLFLPQRAYVSLGSLRAQLSYPFGFAPDRVNQGSVDAELYAALRKVGLEQTLARLDCDLDVVRRWDLELSVGEQQRLAIARLLVQRPMYALLDEATSANDPAFEVIMYECVRTTCEAFVSVGHRPSLEQFHTKRLHLLGSEAGGRWQLDDLSTNST